MVTVHLVEGQGKSCCYQLAQSISVKDSLQACGLVNGRAAHLYQEQDIRMLALQGIDLILERCRLLRNDCLVPLKARGRTQDQLVLKALVLCFLAIGRSLGASIAGAWACPG